MSNFLVFGRPRSRTAWLANFMTYGPSFCFHEGLADSAGSWLELKRRMSNLPGLITGNADTGMIHDVKGALETFPAAKVVMLVENEFSWRTFAHSQNLPKDLVEAVDTDYRRTKKELEHRALFVPVDTLSDEATARKVWVHCTSHIYDFPKERFHMLKDLNVQVIQESLRRRLGVR